MLLRCPECDSAIDLAGSTEGVVVCPTCGGSVSVSGEQATTTFRQPELGKLGRFDLLELLGSGHYGDVFLAHDATLDRQVALKLPRREVLSDLEIERFLREAKAAARLSHPNIVRVHEAGRLGDTAYIISDVVAGVTLAEWLTRHRPAPREAAGLAATLADALEHAHSNKVVHRDLKPRNIMLDESGEPLVMDFGLARLTADLATLTVEGRPLGTPAYMSPEQARGEGHHADRRSDVYSLGVILFEMLTGRRPFQGHGEPLIEKVIHAEPPSLSSVNSAVPRDLETICLKALEKEPARRYPTAAEMAADLRRYLAGEPIQGRRTGALGRGVRWLRRQPLAAAAAGLIVLLTGLVAYKIWNNGASDVTPIPPVLRQVTLLTKPEGARVVLVPISTDNGDLWITDAVRPAEKTPLTVSVPPGEYLVVVDIPDYGFHEVHRRVPSPDGEDPGVFPHQRWLDQADGTVELPEIVIPRTTEVTPGMTAFAGGGFIVGGPLPVGVPPHPRTLHPFLLDATEVSVGQYRNVVGRLPAGLASQDPPPDDQAPVNYVTFDEALAWAEAAGKRLPTEFEYEIAATVAGTRNFPWGDKADQIGDRWQFGPVGQPAFDQTPTDPPVYGLYSNVAEWTDSWNMNYPPEAAIINPKNGLPFTAPWPAEFMPMVRQTRVVRGGPFNVVSGKETDQGSEWANGPRWRHGMSMDKTEPGLGFRCARSAGPRYLAAEAAP